MKKLFSLIIFFFWLAAGNAQSIVSEAELEAKKNEYYLQPTFRNGVVLKRSIPVSNLKSFVLNDFKNYKYSLLPTTTNKVFSSTFNSYQIDDFEIVKKKNEVRIIIVGSSNSEGIGASNYTNSWAGKLQTYLESKGYIVRNVSIGGTNTQNTINRFYSDVLTWNPSIVIEATALFNEGLYSNNLSSLTTAHKNVGLLSNLCSQFGIKFFKGPILPYSQNSDSLKHSLSEWFAFQNDNILLGNGFSVADGFLIDSLVNAGDNIHLNDLGHDIVFSSLNIYRITHPHLFRDFCLLKGNGVTVVDTVANLNNYQSFNINLDNDFKIKNFTICLEIKFSEYSTSGGKGIIAFGGSTFRLRRYNGVLQLVGDNTLTAPLDINLPENLNSWHQIVLSYSRLKNECSFFVNGSKIGVVNISMPDISNIKLLSSSHLDGFQALKYSVRNFYLYNANLNDNICSNFYDISPPKSSLLIASDFNVSVPKGGYFINYACSPLFVVNDFSVTF